VAAGARTGYILRRNVEYPCTDTLARADEVDQIGFRLMWGFALDTLYGVDAGTSSWELYNSKDSLALWPVLGSIYTDWGFTNDDPISQSYSALYDANDAYNKAHSLLSAFRYRNSGKMLGRDFSPTSTATSSWASTTAPMAWRCTDTRSTSATSMSCT